jgi:hypothetical protein
MRDARTFHAQPLICLLIRQFERHKNLRLRDENYVGLFQPRLAAPTNQLSLERDPDIGPSPRNDQNPDRGGVPQIANP